MLKEKPQENAKELEEHEKFLKSIDVIDPAYVEPESMKCAKQMLGSETLRMVAVHHNSLPFPSEDAKEHGFLNASDFNQFLFQNKFRVLLHGHQHIPLTTFYSKPTDTSHASYLGEGLLSIGCPGYFANRNHSGFNIIEIELSDHHDIAEVKVNTLVWDTNKVDFDITVSCRYDVATKGLGEGKRRDILQQLNREIYSDQPPAGLLRALDSWEFFSEHAVRLREFYETYSKIHACYSVSIFSPKTWLNKGLGEILLPYGVQNIAAAAHRASGDQSKAAELRPPLKFRFSSMVCKAIEQACSNASRFKIGQLANESLSDPNWSKKELRPRELGFLRKALNNLNPEGGASLTIWDDNYCCDDDPSCRKTTYITTGTDPIYNYSERHQEDRQIVEGLFEFVRIALWTEKDLTKPSCLDIIELHENLGMPLFWINPDHLGSHVYDKYKRKPAGHTTILALEDQKGGRLTSGQCLAHFQDGKTMNNLTRFCDEIWSGNPPGPLSITSSPFDEFKYLLSLPFIVFVADAWFMKRAGTVSWQKFDEALKFSV